MSQGQLTMTRIRSGVWEGILSGQTDMPVLEVVLLEQILPGVTVTAVAERHHDWAVRVPIPAEVLAEGVQTFLIRDKPSGETLAHFTIITGVAMEDDLRAEVDLLRAELDMLKRAFRRHCVETAV
ncbi:MAG: hypothetical protein ABI832_19095 [bacterium]